MNDKEQVTNLIDSFINLQRIKAAADKESEIEYQIKVTTAKLQAFGIVTEELEIKSKD